MNKDVYVTYNKLADIIEHIISTTPKNEFEYLYIFLKKGSAGFCTKQPIISVNKVTAYIAVRDHKKLLDLLRNPEKYQSEFTQQQAISSAAKELTQQQKKNAPTHPFIKLCMLSLFIFTIGLPFSGGNLAILALGSAILAGWLIRIS